MNESYNLLSVWRAILKWKIQIIIVTVIAVVAAIIVSQFIRPIYEARTIIFASNPTLTDRAYLFEKSTGETPVYQFGGKDDIDRLVSICQSRQVLAHVVEKFNLVGYYQVEGKNAESRFIRAMERLDGNVKILKDEYRGVEITVKDNDRNYSANIANEIVLKSDEVLRRMILKNRQGVKQAFKEKIEKKEAEINDLKNSISNLDQQITQFGLTSEVKQKARLLEFDMETKLEELKKLKELYDHLDISTNEELSFIYIMQKAYPPEKPLPLGIIISVSTLFIVLFISVVTVTLIEANRS